MDIKVEKLQANTVKMEITVPAERFVKAMQDAYRKNASKFNIPGFRKGKAPMAVIEKMYGPEVFFEDATNSIFEETYPTALNEKDVHPVDYPKLDIVQSEKGKDFIYTAEVTVKPEVELGEYKELEIEKASYPVSDEDIDAQVNATRERNSRMITKESAAENGDIVVIDFEGFVDGTAFEGGKATDHELTLGSGQFIPGFEEQLVGKSAGENVDVNVTFPAEYQAEELKGKAATFKVTVKSVKQKELPELNDEFAKDVSEFDTLDEYKADLRKKQEEANANRAKQEFEDAAVKKAVDNATIDLPHAMVDREIDYMVQDLDYRLKYQGLTVEKYMELTGSSMEKLRADFDEIATARVKTNLVLEAISKKENVEVSDEEIDTRAEEIAKQYNAEDFENTKKSILSAQKDIIKEEIANNKVRELIISTAKVKEA